MCLVIFLPGNVGNVSVPSGFARFRFMRCAAAATFRVCTGYANGAYIKCSTKFLSGIALIHVSGDFFAGKRGQCVGTERVC